MLFDLTSSWEAPGAWPLIAGPSPCWAPWGPGYLVGDRLVMLGCSQAKGLWGQPAQGVERAHGRGPPLLAAAAGRALLPLHGAPPGMDTPQDPPSALQVGSWQA